MRSSKSQRPKRFAIEVRSRSLAGSKPGPWRKWRAKAFFRTEHERFFELGRCRRKADRQVYKAREFEYRAIDAPDTPNA